MLSIQMGSRVRGVSLLWTERELTRWRCPNQSSHVLPPTEVSPSSLPNPGHEVLLAPLHLLLLLSESQKPTHLAKSAENDLAKEAEQLSRGLAPQMSSPSARSSRGEAAGAPGRRQEHKDPSHQTPQSFCQFGIPEVCLVSSVRLKRSCSYFQHYYYWNLLNPSQAKLQVSVLLRAVWQGGFTSTHGLPARCHQQGKIFHFPSYPSADACLVPALGLTWVSWESNELTNTSGNWPRGKKKKKSPLFPEGLVSLTCLRKGKVRIRHSARQDCIIWGKTGKRDRGGRKGGGREYRCSNSKEITPSDRWSSVGPYPVPWFQQDFGCWFTNPMNSVQACKWISSSRICHAPLQRGLPAAGWLCRIRSSSSMARV